MDRSRSGKREERCASYWSANLRKQMVQYDCRTADGELFSCIAADLGAARVKRDVWLKSKEA